jgi:hypothetical protein
MGLGPTPETVTAGTGIRLTNRPASYCPTAAQVVIVKSASSTIPEFDELVAITNCDEISLPTSALNLPVEYQLYVLAPNARALRVLAVGPVASFLSAPIQLGDTNEDNVINEADQRFIEARIGQTSLDALAADIDGDATVTILDYSLVATNQGAGYARPDQKPWRDQ